MLLSHFICLSIGMVLTSIFYHAHLNNGVIKVDLHDESNPRFQLCIKKVKKFSKRRYVLLKVEQETTLTQK